MPAARILIVEDEGLTAMELQRKLKFLGYDVPTFAFSGKEAIIKAEELKPDLILMDIVLKGKIDGIDAAEEITKNQDIPVIYLTAHGDETTKKRAKSTGPYAYILKPFDETELQKNIDQALYQHQIDKKLENTPLMDDSIDKSGGAIIVTDTDGIIHFINYSASYLTRWDREEALEKSINEVFKLKNRNSNGLEFNNPVMELLNKNSDEIKGNGWLKSSPNSIIPIQYTVAPVKNENGDLNGATLIFKDMSHVDNVDPNKEFIEKICNQSPIETAVFEKGGSLVYANEAFLNFYSVESVKKLENMNLFSDFGLNDELKVKLDDSGILNHEIKADMAKPYLKSNKIFEKQIYLDLNVNKIDTEYEDNNFNFEGYLLHIKDISEVKHSEKSFNEIKSNYELIFNSINSIDDIFFAMDSNFKCIQWNSAAESLTGINSQEAIGKYIYDLFPELKNSEVEQLYLKVLESQKHQSLIKDMKDDGNGFFEINAYPSKNGVSVIIRDVTLTKKSEEDLKRREKLFKSLLEKQSSPFCVFYEDGSIYFSNNPFKMLTAPLSNSNSNFLEIIPQEESGKLKTFINSSDSSNTDQNLTFETSINNKRFNWHIMSSFQDEFEKQLFFAQARELIFEETTNIEGLESENHSLKSQNQSLNKLKNKLQRNIEDLESEVNDMRHKEEKLISKNQKIKEKLDNDINSLKNKNNDLKLQIAQLKRSEINLNEKITTITSDFQEKIKNLEKNKDLVDSERDEVLESEKNLQESLLKNQRQYNSLLEENKILRNDKSKLKQHTRKVQKEYMGLESEFNERLETYKAQISQLKQINKSLTKEYEFLEKRLSTSREEVETQVKILENEKSFLEKSNDQLQRQLDDSKTGLNEFKKEISSFKKEISELKSNKTSFNDKYNKLHTEYKKKLSDLERGNQTLETELNLLKNKETSLKQKELLLNDEVRKLKAGSADLQSQISILNKNESQMNLKYDELQKSSKTSIKDLESTNKDLKTDLNSLKESNMALIKENKVMIQNFQQKISDLEKERMKILSETELLKKARDDLKSSLEDRNYAIQDMQNQFKRNMQTMNSILGINSTYLVENFLEKTKDTQMQVEIASLAHSNVLQFSELGKVDLNSYLSLLMEDISRYYNLNDNKINFITESNKLLLKSEIASNIGLLISELISHIILNTEKTPGVPINLLISSNQEIIDLEINTDLKVFKNHKTHDLALQIAKTMARQLGGKLNTNFDVKTVCKAQFIIIDNSQNAKD